jgi:transposase-like protein
MMSKQIRKKYPKEFKHEAIGLVVDQGYSKAEAVRQVKLVISDKVKVLVWEI